MQTVEPPFRARLRAAEQLVGTFIRTPAIGPIEILSQIGYDFVVLDAEHAPLDRSQIDVMLFAARACGVAALVRVSHLSEILGALDCGGTGVLVPHVCTPEQAHEVAQACRYRGGKRGYSGSTRSSRYGSGRVWSTVDREDAGTTIIAMIEDPEAVERIDDIAQVEGVDALFIGRGDLAMKYDAPDKDAPVIVDAVRRICAAAKANHKVVAAMVGRPEEAAGLQAFGVTAYIVSTDQGFMRQAAADALAAMRG